MSSAKINALTGLGINVTSGVLAEAVNLHKKAVVERNAQRVVDCLGKMEQFYENLQQKKRKARKELNEAQDSIRDLSKRVSYLNETNDYMPLLQVVDPRGFDEECWAVGKCPSEEVTRLNNIIIKFTPKKVNEVAVDLS